MTLEAKAREIAERHGFLREGYWSWALALTEALLTQPLPEWSETPMTHPFEALKASIHADPECAWGWQCNLAVPIMDAAGVSHKDANRAAALIMAQMFDYDITTYEAYEWGKSPQQAYYEVRVAAERAEDVEASTYEAAPTPTKPDELPEWALRQACADLGVTWQEFTELPRGGILKAVLPYARLLVRIKELDGPKEEPDLVLAREIAAQEADRETRHGTSALMRIGHRDTSEPVQRHLRTIKHLRDAGWKEG